MAGEQQGESEIPSPVTPSPEKRAPLPTETPKTPLSEAPQAAEPAPGAPVAVPVKTEMQFVERRLAEYQHAADMIGDGLNVTEKRASLHKEYQTNLFSPVQKGMMRLYRGERETTPIAQAGDLGRYFTTSFEDAELLFSREPGMVMRYVDIPTQDAKRYLAKNSSVVGGRMAPHQENEYFLPFELSSKRRAMAIPSELAASLPATSNQQLPAPEKTSRFARIKSLFRKREKD